jgi:hypothetical protein
MQLFTVEYAFIKEIEMDFPHHHVSSKFKAPMENSTMKLSGKPTRAFFFTVLQRVLHRLLIQL